jgi:hypothetical protein
MTVAASFGVPQGVVISSHQREQLVDLVAGTGKSVSQWPR